MDDELDQLEAELKRLRPMAPSDELIARLGRELDRAPANRRAGRTWWLWAGALPIAAALAILITVVTRPDAGRAFPVPPSASAVDGSADAPFQPVAADNLLYAARDDGLVTLSDGTPARRERLDYVDTITWKDPRTNASVRWSVPREEVRVVPVSFQ